MRAAERSVLHVLPHPGGGGETYVDALGAIPGYRSSRVFLAPSRTPTGSQLARGVVEAFRRAPAHDLVHVHGEVASGLCLPLLATRTSVVTLHGLNLVRRLSGVRRQGATLNLRAVLRAADRTICVSSAERDHLAGVVGLAAARRALVVHNGVRLPPRPSADERAGVRRQLGLEESQPLAIWVGALEELKRPLAAVHAATLASVGLLLVGDGPLRSEVERAARGPIRVLGQRDDLPRLLAAADFFVLTSGREGLAFSLLEAMAHGLPPVVTDLRENLEAVGDAGLPVPGDDVAALAEAFRTLAEDEGARVLLGERARRRIAERFDRTAMIRRTGAVYDGLVGSRPGSRSPRTRPLPTAQ
jgi:glycosyltransferase involved in cell wall biosynthesis